MRPGQHLQQEHAGSHSERTGELNAVEILGHLYVRTVTSLVLVGIGRRNFVEMQNMTEVRKCSFETIYKIYKLAYNEVLEIQYILRLLNHLPEMSFIKRVIVHIIAHVGHARVVNPPEDVLPR